MRILLTSISCMLCCGIAHAESLKAVLNVPTAAIAGDDVVIDTTRSTGNILKRHIKVEQFKDGQYTAPKRDMVDYGTGENGEMNYANPKPRCRTFSGTYRVTLLLIDKEGDYAETTAMMTFNSEDCPPSPCPPAPDCPDCPVCPKPEPKPPQPEPDTFAPPPLPTPNVQGSYGVGNQVAKAVQDVYRLRIAGKPANEHMAIYRQWAAEVDQAAGIADSIWSQIEAGAINSVMQIKPVMPSGVGWDIASSVLSKLVLDTYKANPNKLKLSLTGGITAKDEWVEFLKTEFSGGIRAAK